MEKKATTHPQTEETKPTPISKGEKIFDWMVYGGIAGLGTFLATIPITHWAQHGGGTKYFKALGRMLEKSGVDTKTAEQSVMTTALMQGGNLALIPVKLAEDNKVAIVSKINNAIGEKTDKEALEAEDKQSWGSIIKARIVAWGLVFASIKAGMGFLGEKKFAAFEEGVAKNLVCKPLGKPTHVAGKETTSFRMGKIAALDFFATAAASGLLYVGSRIFAHWERKNQLKTAANMQEDKPSSTPETFADQPENIPTSKVVQKIVEKKSAVNNFAEAALASRSQEARQIGA